MVKKKKKKKSGLFSKKALTKPKAKITKLSAEKVVKQLARETSPLVREVEEREIDYDDRSLFFKRELVKEKGWLS